MKATQKLFALLMAVIMLAGMLPVHSAEADCKHKWGPKQYNGIQPTCIEPASWWQTCTKCGDQRDGEEYGPHQWAGWKTTVEPTCNKEGKQERTCKLCKRTEHRTLNPLAHTFGKWIDDVKPTCMGTGLQYKKCSLCGYNEWRYTDKLDHLFGEWYVVNAPQVGLPGLEQRDCTYGCGTMEQREIPPLSEGDNIPPAAELPTVVLEKHVMNTPANGEFFVPGEAIQFGFTLWVYGPGRTKASSEFMVNQATIFDPLKENPFVVADMGGTWNMGSSFLYTVTEEDALRGYVANTGYATWVYVENGQPGRVDSNTVTTPCGAEPLSADGLSLSLALSSTPANGTHFVVGEEVTFTETWSNGTGKTLYPFSVSIFTCDTPAFGSAVDQISSWFAEDAGGPVAPGAAGSHSLTVTVTEADVARGAIYAMAELLSTVHNGPDLENVTTPFVTAPCAPVEPDAKITKYVSVPPANGEYFVPGETIEYAVVFTNVTEHELHDVEVFDPLKGSNEDIIIAREPVVAPNGVLHLSFRYIVTEEDAARGSVVNTASATWLNPETEEWNSCDSNNVIAPCGEDDAGDFGLSDGLTVTKRVTSTPANGSYYEPGEDIIFGVTVSNQGTEQLLNVNVIDPLGGGLVTVLETLNVGETRDIPVVFTTTDLVAWAGSVDNGACVKAVDKDGRQYVEYSNIVNVPCGHTFLDVTVMPEGPFGVFHSLSLVKAEESLPLNGTFYTEGEVIHYRITYTNDGELPLTDVQVWDTMDISTPLASAEMLQPGESRTCYFQHTVTAADVDAGYVMNMAQGNYLIPGSTGYAGANSNMVYSRTDDDETVWIELPIFPTPGTGPEYDPGTGWFPGGDAPTFGSIDVDALQHSDSYCVRTITGRDNVSVSYETAFCPAHSMVQSSALMMAQAASTPETQMQAAAYAVALWRPAVDALYKEIFEASDATAQAVVMTEYIRFLTDVANDEAILNHLYPDQPALVAQKIAGKWENKCIDLCYDAHAAAAERKDSLLAVTSAAGAASEACTCEVTAQEAGKQTDLQRYCPAHGFVFGMLDALLQGQDTAERWTMVRQIWGVELTNAYNKLYAAMGDNQLLALAEYNALTQWMMAREASLMALYPNNPEIVVQLMVKTIMERVNALCQITQ